MTLPRNSVNQLSSQEQNAAERIPVSETRRLHLPVDRRIAKLPTIFPARFLAQQRGCPASVMQLTLDRESRKS